MLEIMLGVALLLQIIVVGLVVSLRRVQGTSDTGTLKITCDALQKGQEKLEIVVRDEMVVNRREAGDHARVAREENNSSLKMMGEGLGLQLGTHLKTASDSQKDQLIGFETQLRTLEQGNKRDASQLREELSKSFTQFSESLMKQVTNATALQGQRFEQFETRLNALTINSTAQNSKLRETLEALFCALQEDSTQRWDIKRKEDTTAGNHARQELNESLLRLADSVSKNVAAAGEAQRTHFDSITIRIDKISENTDKRMETLRGVVDERLKSMQDDNGKKLELMRQTVDEKLQGTLNQRLGESFKIVSERLELVHKGLGEMQSLANGVGDLKKVLSNVKTRGNWGEIQLGNLLEQMLTAQQYDKNIATIPGSSERVEFAIKLPGRDESQDVLWLPIDAKFPQEHYARLIEAHDAGNVEAIEAHGKHLELQIKKCAQDICSKYVQAPYTTDFAIMFLPIEGLYAEVIRRTGLVDILHRECRVTIAGPTTLSAILNSLQMGFRTLAIQQRSSEVWGTLSAVKTEFSKYGEVLDVVQKKLKEASNKIDDTRTRSRVIERKLRNIESLPEVESQPWSH